MQTPKAERQQVMQFLKQQVVKNPYSCAEWRYRKAAKAALVCLGALSVSADFCLRAVFPSARGEEFNLMPAFSQCCHSPGHRLYQTPLISPAPFQGRSNR